MNETTTRMKIGFDFCVRAYAPPWTVESGEVPNPFVPNEGGLTDEEAMRLYRNCLLSGRLGEA